MKPKTTAEGLEQSRAIIRTQAATESELEALRLVAATSRELEDATAQLFQDLDFVLSHEATRELLIRSINKPKDPRPAPDRVLDQLDENIVDRYVSARSANDIALHRWEWWTWNADGSRGEKRT